MPEPEQGDEWPPTVAFDGAMVAAAVLAVVALVGISQGQLEDCGTDTAVARTLLTLGWDGV